MADDVEIKDGNDALVAIAGDEIASKKYQRIKLIHGADGVNAGDVSSANPLPVTDTGHATNAALLSSIATLLTATNGYVDGLEGLLGVLHTDLLGVLHTDLLTVDGHVDGLETLVTALNALLTSGNTVRSNILTAIGGVTATPVTGQKKVAVTGTAVQLIASSTPLVNGAQVQANPNNTAAVTIGLSGVTNTVDGTGDGKVLQPGQAWAFAITNLNLLYVNGTAGDWVDWSGN